MPVGHQIYIAQWIANHYTITFDSTGGTPVDAIEDIFGATITPPAAPTKPGYSFAGWSPVLPTTMPGSNDHHHAQWTPNQYTLSFDSD